MFQELEGAEKWRSIGRILLRSEKSPAPERSRLGELCPSISRETGCLAASCCEAQGVDQILVFRVLDRDPPCSTSYTGQLSLHKPYRHP